MKNQYFGDINDYQKFGLLRLVAAAKLKPILAWMLTSPAPLNRGKRPEGARLAYLDDPERYRGRDPQLFDKLEKLLPRPDRSAHSRHVSLVHEAGLVPGLQTFDELLCDDRVERQTYFQRLWAASRGSDVVIFDPDNGIQTDRLQQGRRESDKYIYWDELKAGWQRDHSLIVFQHFWRQERGDCIRKRVERAADELQTQPLAVLRFQHAFYLLLAQESHKQRLHQAVKAAGRNWKLREEMNVGRTLVFRSLRPEPDSRKQI